MRNLAAAEFKLLAELRYHDFGFEQVKLSKVKQDKSLFALNKKLIQLLTCKLVQRIDHIIGDPVENLSFFEYTPVHQPLSIVDISIDREGWIWPGQLEFL